MGYAPLTGSNGCDYAASVTIAGLTYDLIIDSGSSNFAVAASSCTNCDGISPLYAGSLTSTTVNLQYGSGSFDGSITSALTFTFGGLSASMQVIAITDQDDFFNCANASQGIMGIAYPSLSQNSLTISIDALVSAGVPDGFALQLCAGLTGSSSSSKSGNMWIGGYDSTFTSGPMQWVAITTKEWYGCVVNGFAIGGTAISGFASLNSPKAIIDSGTTQLVINNEANYNILLAAINTSSIISFTSSMTANDISEFWQGEVQVPTSWYTLSTTATVSIQMQAPGGGSVSISIPNTNWFTLDTGYLSFTGLGFDSTGKEGTIVGETLFANYVVFFDRGTGSRIGFAPGINCFNTATAAGINNYATGAVTHSTTTAGVAKTTTAVAKSTTTAAAAVHTTTTGAAAIHTATSAVAVHTSTTAVPTTTTSPTISGTVGSTQPPTSNQPTTHNPTSSTQNSNSSSAGPIAGILSFSNLSDSLLFSTRRLFFASRSDCRSAAGACHRRRCGLLCREEEEEL